LPLLESLNLLKPNCRLKYFLPKPAIFSAALFAALAIIATAALAQTPVGVVTTVSGSAGIQRAGGSISPHVGTQLDLGDHVTTGADGHLAATLTDNSQLELAESSTLVLDQMVFGTAGRISTRLTLAIGALRSSVTSAVGGVPNFEVHTPNAVVAVRGTKWNTRYHEGTERPGFPSCKRFTDVEVYEGTVDVGSALTPSAQHQAVSAGYETTVACDSPPLDPGPLGITGTGGIGGFRGLAPGAGGVSPPLSVEPPPVIPKPPPGNGG
jgi:ferric-dicitrate binding protein FerR (iron transport regulator)